jgi:hypothetical protein
MCGIERCITTREIDLSLSTACSQFLLLNVGPSVHLPDAPELATSYMISEHRHYPATQVLILATITAKADSAPAFRCRAQMFSK